MDLIRRSETNGSEQSSTLVDRSQHASAGAAVRKLEGIDSMRD